MYLNKTVLGKRYPVYGGKIRNCNRQMQIGEVAEEQHNANKRSWHMPLDPCIHQYEETHDRDVAVFFFKKRFRDVHQRWNAS